MARFTGLWRHRDFRQLWIGESVSVFGSLIGGAAYAFTAVLWLDAGPVGLAVLQVSQVLPMFLIAPFAGVWVDRLHKRPIMIATDIGRFAVLASIPLAALFDVLTLAQLCAVAAAAGALRVFFDIAYSAYLPSLVEREQLVEGNAKLNASASVAEVSGFGIAGWLVQAFSGPGAILVDAVTFLVSAVFLRRIRRPEPPPAPAHEREHVLREAIEGARVVATQPILRSLGLSDMLLNVGNGMVTVAYLPYLVGDLGWGPGVLGTIFAVGGLTSLGGAFIASRPHLYRAIGPALVVAAFVRAVGLLFMPLAAGVNGRGAAALVANQLVTDPAGTFGDIHETSLRQAITPDRLMGRVGASMRVLGLAAFLLGNLVAALVGSFVGNRETLFAAVGAMLLSALVLLFSPVARLRTTPAAVATEGEAG